MLENKVKTTETISFTINGKPVNNEVDVKNLLIQLSEKYSVNKADIKWFSWTKEDNHQVYAFSLPTKVNLKYEYNVWKIWSGRFLEE